MIFAARDGLSMATLSGDGEGCFLRSTTIGRLMEPLRRVMLAGLALMAPAAAIAQEGRMTKTARGEFTVSLEPLELEGVESADKRGRMSIDKRITGDLVATTHGQMLTAMSDVQGSAVYVAIERVTGTLDGRDGSFVLHPPGRHGARAIVAIGVRGTGLRHGRVGRHRR
ncbi:DUF3224 domain-containing protein [Luteimonas saliphila]|uniref:DUF3224 domain-containing protein n=1 Tax=Luteimonas saliphila TaxID=2804919 RepID=UPI0030801E96